MKPCPKPGIYPGVSFQEYLSWDAISNTSLQVAARSMAHYRNRKPVKETRPMILGTLTHSAQFEASYVNERYAFMPDYAAEVQAERIAANLEPFERPSASKPYKDKVKAFLAKTGDKVVIHEQEFTDLIGMIRGVSADKLARAYLTGGQYEVVIVARDPVTGLLCKGRLDHLRTVVDPISGGFCHDDPKALITDLKSTQDASEFEKTISNYSYHRQLTMYGDMLGWLDDELTCDIKRGLVVVESGEPYCVRSGPLDEEAIEIGREEYRELLNAIDVCSRQKSWPGYANPTKWRLPQFHGKYSHPVNTIPAETV